MKGYKVIPTELDSYNESKSNAMKSAVKGQFYEFYCYNELIQKYPNINIIKANYVERRSKGNFRYTPTGKIIYCSKDHYLAEFDVLGIEGKTIHWWEITRSKIIDRKGISRKTYLLKKLFNNYIINFKLIVPRIIQGLEMFEYEIIDEPDYEPYFECGYFKFNKKISKCFSLKALNSITSDFDYIDEIIMFSYLYYKNNNPQEIINEMKNHYLITRIYDIDNIKDSCFSYYDINLNKEGFIEIKTPILFIDNDEKIVSEKHKYEILSIINRLAYRNQ